DWEHNLERIHRKFETARTLVPEPIIDQVDGAQVAILSLGSNDPAVAEARDRLRAAGVETSYLRLRALPHTQSVRDFMAAYDRVFVVENNYDGQLCQILASAEPDLASRLVSVARCNGLPLSARWIADTIRQHLDGDQAA
ncbi:ferredoxin oxidoreductase, partial [Litorilinea aerophila]